ncbi:MAG TPA: MarR family transcriptional regulator [Capsulimonadaceae bacterium]|jgi:DNA-binding MarR family transcriptional regulator
MNDTHQCPTEGAIGLLALLISTGRLAEGRLDDALAEAGLTFVKWRALNTLLVEGSPLPLCALAGKLSCVKSNITQLVDKLEGDCLVERVSAPDDRRSTLLRLTEPGVDAHKRGREALERATSTVCAELTADQRQSLRILLETLAS